MRDNWKSILDSGEKVRFRISFSHQKLAADIANFGAFIHARQTAGLPFPHAAQGALRKWRSLRKHFDLDAKGNLLVADELLDPKWCPDAVVFARDEQLDFLRLQDEAPFVLGRQISQRQVARSTRKGLRFNAPGVYRLQHAGLLIRTENAGVIIDPHLSSHYEPERVRSYFPADIVSMVDAVLITHSHEDHFHLSSLLHFSPEVPIVVPEVGTPSVICPPMARLLREAGFKGVIEGRWNSRSLKFGDIEVFCLPFYGEQTTRYEAAYRNFQNFGNTYLIKTPHWTCWVLADSGNDCRGGMLEVARRLHKRGMQPDLVVSNLRVFAANYPHYITGDCAYWLALSPEQRSRFPEFRGEPLTLGPAGLAEVMIASGADLLLPYANLFTNLGESPQCGPYSEAGMAARLRQELRLRGSKSKVAEWRIGWRWHGRVGRRGKTAP